MGQNLMNEVNLVLIYSLEVFRLFRFYRSLLAF